MAKPAGRTAKAKKVTRSKQVRLKRRGRGSLRSALLVAVKETSSRDDIVEKFKGTSPKFAKDRMHKTSIKERAGYPIKRAKGSADPANWKTVAGKPVTIDFGRAPWLPDDWAQGVKSTEPIARSRPGFGGTYTVYMSPEGRTFYHGWAVEDHLGRKLGPKDGFLGQLRLAWLQGKQTQIPTDADASFFKVLSARERKCLPKPDDFHYCIVSARRASSIQGMKSIASVQAQFVNAGVTPTWYVDAESLADYRKLGLRAVVGGPLTAARNKALNDAFRKGKVCVQCSDDISAWEYRDGPLAKERTFDAMNAAFDAATRFLISPVQAARFILAKMRGATDKVKPRLGGVYMLGSCSRTFCDEPETRAGFILGDFFVVDKSSPRFDENMKLKEDYDFTCAHLAKYGSVMRLNRMTVSAKHYTNVGGAVANRDKKGMEEKRNIEILFTKWPGAFSLNGRRTNEVLLKWGSKKHQRASDGEEADKGAGAKRRRSQ